VGEDVCIHFMDFPFVAEVAIHIFQELEVGVLLPSSSCYHWNSVYE
jgi:hypothetical protein